MNVFVISKHAINICIHKAYSRNLGQCLILARKDTFLLKKSIFVKKGHKNISPQKGPAFNSQTQCRSIICPDTFCVVCTLRVCTKNIEGQFCISFV